ncbi:hypothetical protein Hanom_Chr10g00887671 [Helianthus anomalus]
MKERARTTLFAMEEIRTTTYSVVIYVLSLAYSKEQTYIQQYHFLTNLQIPQSLQ